MKITPPTTRHLTGLMMAGLLSVSSAVMAAEPEWIPVGEPAAAKSVPPAMPAPVAPSAIPASPAPAAAPAPAAELSTGAPVALTEEELQAAAYKQILQTAWIHLNFVQQRLAEAKAGRDGYFANFQAAEAASAPYAAAVQEKTAAVKAIREEVEGQMAAIKEKYDERLVAKTEEEFDLQDQLSKVGPLEYLPEMEAARQNRIAAIKARQVAIRDEVHVIESAMNDEVEAVRVNLDKAREELRAAEDAYTAHYGDLSDARAKAYLADENIYRFEQAIPPAQARLEEAKKSYQPYGDPEAVIASTQMPAVELPSHQVQNEETLRVLQAMVAEFEAERAVKKAEAAARAAELEARKNEKDPLRRARGTSSKSSSKKSESSALPTGSIPAV